MLPNELIMILKYGIDILFYFFDDVETPTHLLKLGKPSKIRHYSQAPCIHKVKG